MLANTTPTASCRRLSTRRFTIGFSVVSSCQMNAIMPNVAMTASTTISVDSNQSLDSPRSRRICSAPTPMMRKSSPSQSTPLSSCTLYFGSGTYDHVRYAARMPSGILM